jgi:hypothetical protein
MNFEFSIGMIQSICNSADRREQSAPERLDEVISSRAEVQHQGKVFASEIPSDISDVN